METIDTLIIGAGPAGLTTAYQLAKAGHDVTVIEQDARYVGGISRTVSYKGFLFDIGGHRFFSKSREVVAFWNEILPDDFLERPRLSRIYYGGKFYAYPLKAMEAFRNLGPWQSLLCVLSYAYARAFPVEAPKTFHQWVRNHFGERLFTIFFKTYTEKVWGMGCDEISADWAAQRIKGLDLATALIDGLKRSLRLKPNGASTAKTLIESFRYPRRGPGMMWEEAARKIKDMGGRILMDRRFEKLHFDASRRIWTIDVIRSDGTHESFAAVNVVSSAPIREVLAALDPAPFTLLHARALKYRDFLTVVLIGRTEQQWPDNWIYIHDPKVKVGRVQNFRSWSPEMVPDATSTCLGLEYFCNEEDALWSMEDSVLIVLAKKEIDMIGLMKSAEVYDACVVRQKKAYPVYDGAYLDKLAMIRFELESRFPRLHLIGRNGMHKYNNQDHAMMTGMLTAENILAGHMVYDVWAVNEDAEYGEAGLSGAREALASVRLVPRKVA
ncbi:MAG: NAD(P)/FAD-dependent oxidoreductase [Alphaproteobacteria bacterium]|nr:NAD(P)/FAD-dependent oxidoreductase [Alphaproteobacteria bacterium]